MTIETGKANVPSFFVDRLKRAGMRRKLARIGSRLFWWCVLSAVLSFVSIIVGAIMFGTAPEVFSAPMYLVMPLFFLSLFANLAVVFWPRDKSPKQAP